VNKADQLQSELRRANLLPTRQRIALGSRLFGCDDRHVTAEALYEQAISMKMLLQLSIILCIVLLKQGC